MCHNATKTASQLLQQIKPTLKILLPLLGVSAEQQQEVFTAYDAALLALQNWTPGTNAQVAIEAVNALAAIFNALPVPAEYKALASVIAAGISVVIGVLEANQPATTEVTQAAHAHMVITETTSKVQQLVPGFKRSIWHTAANQYKDNWNRTVVAGGFPNIMEV